MGECTMKFKHILAALCISLVLCAGITLVFWASEKKNVMGSGYTPAQIERTENIVS